METKLNYKRTFLIGLAFLSICSFWQMYDNIIPLILQNTYHLGETMTGAVMALDNVLAIFLLPVFGTLSDKVHTKLGRRMPFIVVGTILAVIFMMMLPMIDNAEKARWATGGSFSNQVFFLGVLFLTLVSMGLYRSPAVALMPDVTPNHLRSRANAVINLMGAVGGVYALIMIKVLVGKGETPDYLPLFASIAAVMAIAVGILVITIRENKLREEVEKAEKDFGRENGSVLIMAAIESARGVMRALDICEASERLFGIALSGGDYTKDLQTHITGTGVELMGARQNMVIAARAAGVQCFDTVYTDLDNMEGFRQDVETIHLMGFDGKSIINPRQIDIVHEIFTPSQKDIIFAEKVVREIDDKKAKGIGVFTVDGKMIDIAFYDGAKRTIELAKASGVYKGDL